MSVKLNKGLCHYLNSIVSEMYEDFIISEACSRFYAFESQEFEAQDIILYNKYMEHADFCKKVSHVCSQFLKTKNVLKFYCELKKLGLQNIVFNKRY